MFLLFSNVMAIRGGQNMYWILFMYNNLGSKSSYAVTVQSFAFITGRIREFQSLTLEIHYMAV